MQDLIPRAEQVGQTGISANIYTSPEQRGTLVRLLHERGSIQNLELELRTKSGELRTVLCSVQTLPIDGETCALASMVDITKRKQAEATLQRSAKRLLVLADTSHALAEAGADEQAVLALVARTSAEVFGSLCTLRMFSEDGQWLTTVALHHAGVDARDAAEIARASTPMPVEVVQSLLHTLQHTHAHVLEAADIEHVRNQMSTETRPLFEYVEEEQHLVAPLRVGSQMIGILVMMRSNGRRVPFTEDDVHLAHELANRAGGDAPRPARPAPPANLYPKIPNNGTIVHLDDRPGHGDQRRRIRVGDLAERVQFGGHRTDRTAGYPRGDPSVGGLRRDLERAGSDRTVPDGDRCRRLEAQTQGALVGGDGQRNPSAFEQEAAAAVEAARNSLRSMKAVSHRPHGVISTPVIHGSYRAPQRTRTR